MKNGDVVKFKLLIRGPLGNEWWEQDERIVGTQTSVRGHGLQPEFTGDIEKWGRELIAWFNKDEPADRHRAFIRAELINDEQGE